MKPAMALAALVAFAPAVLGGEADVINVKIRQSAPGIYDFDITVRSHDKGWEYYADAFEVLAPDGKVLGRRVLLHPHETEQPFTRDLHGVRIPAGVREVVVRARHKPRGYDGETRRVPLPGR
ncbi:MAG: hypothetical protein ACT4P9_03365 [Betaproteobacteria bacterium]